MSNQKVSKQVAFGSNVPRTKKMFFHPFLDPQGLTIDRPLGCDPALYHPQSTQEVYKKLHSAKKDPWHYKVELTDWCKNLGYKNQKILERRRWFATLLGPAWTTVPDPIKYEAACKNVGFGRVTRFKPSKFHGVPGTGTYFRGEAYKVPYGPHSTRPTFERGPPCRFPDTTPRWSLAPNRYNIVDKEDIEHKPKKGASIRGPYDMFTGKRDGSTIKNHFGQSQKVFSKTWPLKFPGCLERLKKNHAGEWNKTGRDHPPRNRVALTDLAMIPRRVSDPSPASYFEFEERKVPQNKHGFNSSYDQPPGYVKMRVWPGVGRYTLGKSRNAPGHGHRHVFISKVGRTIGAVLPQPMNNF
ncbi:hypothetical protein O0L34_g2225 [Tuta absoluta]|nr:hypothetical protein O0L34_g2225 [Tuta absoluta]